MAGLTNSVGFAQRNPTEGCWVTPSANPTDGSFFDNQRRPVPTMPTVHVLSQLQKTVPDPFNNQRGVTYLALMFLVVLIGISLMAVNQHWSVILKRDREKELVFRGMRIQQAIERYAADFEVQKGTRQNQYPLTLEALTKRPKRYLQVVYKDPITGEDFELMKRGAEIRGVRSTSLDPPMDQVTFPAAQRYHDIHFEASIQGVQPKKQKKMATKSGVE